RFAWQIVQMQVSGIKRPQSDKLKKGTGVLYFTTDAPTALRSSQKKTRLLTPPSFAKHPCGTAAIID
ncbi:MAG TPA: hypothetical protein VI753_07105, partial [Anaerolineales bacterium]|nr:hypothetical protein [Anaerolineales bacterium]